MPGFTALNIEPDDQSDDEIDNTKEIQIEEALKLYQAALKLHAQGPVEYVRAAEAYGKLFTSEIFKYPESETEFLRIYKNPELEFADGSYSIGLDPGSAGGDIPSSLPQLLHLSYKNHGQFILDCVKNRMRQQSMPRPALDYQSIAAIDNFGLALASDESDTELWRRTARVASMLGSQRIARYCLEAAVEVDDDPTVAEVDPMSLEEGYAGEQLKEHLNILGDEIALSHPVMLPFLKKEMPPLLLKHMDPYPFLPDSNQLLEDEIEQDPQDVDADSRIIIGVETRSWTALGQRLGDNIFSPLGLSGTGIVFQLPEAEEIAPSIEPMNESEVAPVEDSIMKDIETTESPAVERSESVTPVGNTIVRLPSENPPSGLPGQSSDSPRLPNLSLPTRKRSQSSANIRETPETDSGAQKRSKRIKNRDTTLDTNVDPSAQYAQDLKRFHDADGDVFTFVGTLLNKIGVNDLGKLGDTHSALSEKTAGTPEIPEDLAMRDLRSILRVWNEDQATTYVNANAAEILGSSGITANAGLAAFLEHSNSGPQKPSVIPPFDEELGIAEFATKVETKWMPLTDVVFEWMCSIMRTYKNSLWSDTLKVTLVRIISFGDGEILSRIKSQLDRARLDGKDLAQLEELVLGLFELHIDIYSRITNPSSIVSFEIRLATKDRLDRWADLAAGIIHARSCDEHDELSLRYLWASVFYASLADNVSREHTILCWTDLQEILSESGTDTIELHNNAVMREISVEAAEREVSRLTTMDLFQSLFQADTSDPVRIIETLEPVLDPDTACGDSNPKSGEETASTPEITDMEISLREMRKFIKAGNTNLRLFLWQRLREAYSTIGYTTKVFSCHLKSIEVIVADLRSKEYLELNEKTRQNNLLTLLKVLDDLLVKSLTLALNEASASFEIIDDRHLKSTAATLARLTRILHSSAAFDDQVRVGMTQLPQTAAYLRNGSFSMFINKLREMTVRTWALQYTMIKEAISQNPELFPTPDSNLADFLGLVHYSLGMRQACKSSNKIFLKMMKVELIRLKNIERWEDYLGQVLYDLYGLKLGVGTYLLEDHGCPTETLDRRTVLNIADQVIALANSMPMKDLLKHELRGAIEKMQTAVGLAKDNMQMSHNLRNYTEYLKTSIRPLDMYKAWSGQIMVDSLPVVGPASPFADKGWYFLLGMIFLSKFRSTKRVQASSQNEDLKTGASFMRTQLQCNPENWETWYRMAQCFDCELEEEIMWSAAKINHSRQELIKLQRNSIHCYVIALSTAMRNADDSFATAKSLSEMYYDFGMRIYASSRDPFNMEVFWVDGFEKHMSGAAGMYIKPLHEEMSRYKVWKYAAKLFRESLRERPNYWMNHFMLGKCLWKMFCKTDPSAGDSSKRPSLSSLLAAFVNAISTVPKPRDNRQEPILEPHYKLISVVYKLVQREEMTPQAGADLLQQQPFAINKGEPVIIEDYEEWEPFILQSLRVLRTIDKQHWHHRMIARVVNILYDEDNPDSTQANAAKLEFKESIFTKTMHIQVWKPDAERPGRHCVYMERYVKLMTHILGFLNDKASMELLIKRVKKKDNDFYKFQEVWTNCCTTYIRLIRSAADVPPDSEEAFKTVSLEEYEIVCERLIKWLADPNSSHPARDALREACELKALNKNAMGTAPITDVINDIWAVLYTQVGKNLPGPDPVQNALDSSDAVRGIGPMSLNNLVMDMNGTQIPVPVTIAGSSVEGAKARKLGISRREVTKRAEMGFSKLPELPKVKEVVEKKTTGRGRGGGEGSGFGLPEPGLVLGSNIGKSGSASRSGSVSVGTPRERGEHGQSEVGTAGQEDESKMTGIEEAVTNTNTNANTPRLDNDHEDEGETEVDLDRTENVDMDAPDEVKEERDKDPEVEGEDQEHENDHDHEQDEEESERGSVHDSADDESDLSSVPDGDDLEVPFSAVARSVVTGMSSIGEGSGGAGKLPAVENGMDVDSGTGGSTPL